MFRFFCVLGSLFFFDMIGRYVVVALPVHNQLFCCFLVGRGERLLPNVMGRHSHHTYLHK